MNQKQKSRFVFADEILSELEISEQTLASKIRDGLFPKPLRLGLRKRVWMRSQLDAFYQQAAEAESNGV